MLWTPRLNALGGEFQIGAWGRAQVISWNHQSHLPDNAPHRHTYFEICTVGAHGRGEFRALDAAYAIESGDTFWVRPGAIHQIVNTDESDMELFWVSFSLDARSQEARDFADRPVVVTPDQTLASLWQTLRVAGEASSSGEWVLRQLAGALLGALLSVGAAAQPDAPPASDARALQCQLALRYIHDNLAKRMTLPEIAAHIHVSPRQLVRLFRLFVEISPAQYIERARLDRAESLLLRSSKPLKSVAREVGFEDIAHFTRVFSRRSGNPPGDFRRRGGPLIEKPSGPNIQKLGDLV